MNRSQTDIPSPVIRQPMTMLFAALVALVLAAPAAQARPNLTAKFQERVSAVRPLPPNRWCTLTVLVENRGDQSFNNDFLVKVRARSQNYFWNNVSGFTGIRGGDCGPVSNGVNCWLRPIGPGRAAAFRFDIYPRTSGSEALIIYVDTTNAVRESHEANTFITAASVRSNACPR